MYKNFVQSQNTTKNTVNDDVSRLSIENTSDFRYLDITKIKLAKHNLINRIDESDFNSCGEIIIRGLIKDISDVEI